MGQKKKVAVLHIEGRKILLDSLGGVEQAQAALDNRRQALIEEGKAQALRAAEAVAKQYGYTLSELMTHDPKARKPRKGKKVVKYRNPSDPSETWSGRGQRPVWINRLDEAGELETAKA